MQYCKNWHTCNLAMFLFREVIKFGGECREHLFKGVLCPSESPRHLCNRQVESVIMGYALLFARSLSNTARKNQLNYETAMLQIRKSDITSNLADIQKAEEALKSQAENMPKDGGPVPNLEYLKFARMMLVSMDKSLDIRLACIKTKIAQIEAEEQGVNESLANAVASSTPKYAG